MSGNYFDTLGVPAALGRVLLVSDDRDVPGERVAVLSDAYWTRRFGRDPGVIGRSLRLKGTMFTIVGVGPNGFSGESPGETLDMWLPLTAQPAAPSWLWNGHSTTWLRILARRRGDVTFAQARAGLETVYARIRDDVAAGTDSAEFRASVLESRLAVSEASRGASRLRDNLSAPLLIVMVIVGLVLLVACANVANLVLARAATKRREAAVCLALGAARSRLVRQGFLEALLLAAAGGLAGVVVASWGTSTLEALVSGALPVSLDVTPDRRVFAFAGLITCATVLLFGVIPVLRVSRIDPLGTLRSVGGVAQGMTRIPFGRTLVVTQIAVSLVLLVVAGLFVRSLFKLKDIDTGFDPDRVLLVRITPPAAAEPVSPAVRRGLYRQLLERAKTVPGVEGVSASFSGVFSRETWRNAVTIEGVVPSPGVIARTFVNAVTPEYFEVMRIAVLRGRGLTDGDHETGMSVAVVNETFTQQFFAGADAVGRRVGFCSSEPCDSSRAMMTIVGVSENVKYTDLRETPRAMLYVPFTQVDQSLVELQVRTAVSPEAIAANLHRELAAFDARLGIVGMIDARDSVNGSIVAERLIAKLSATFGLLALGLAVVGLYGLIAYVTAQRHGEIGLRIALGADRRDVRRLVLGGTLRLLLVGITIGIPAAMAGARLLAGQLHEVAPSDPLAVLLALAMLSGAAFLAGYLPARRAARVDPVIALRHD